MTRTAARGAHTGFFHSAGQRVRFRTRGDGPPLLMVHGIGAPLEMWRPLEPKLADFQTITVDPPGAGKSSMPEGRFRMAEFAQVLDDLLRHLRLDSANVLGLSLGGMMVQELAHRSPERVEKLVLASTSYGWTLDPRNVSLFATPARHYARRRGKQPARIPRKLRTEDGFSLLRLHWQVRSAYKPTVPGYLLGLRAAWTWTSRPWLGDLQMPVLVLAGSDDSIVPVSNSRIIASRVPDGRLEVFPGGGHLCVLRESVRASRLIRDFLLP